MKHHPAILFLSCLSCLLSTALGCFNRQTSQEYLQRLSGAHPELAKATHGFDEKYLRRISKLSPMTKMKINFCNGLRGSTSPIVHRLGDAVDCKGVFERFGRERKSKSKGNILTEVSNYIEDDSAYEVQQGAYEPINEDVFLSEQPWTPTSSHSSSEKPFISDSENFYSEPVDEMESFHGDNEETFHPIPTQLTRDYPKHVPLSETTFSVISSDPHIPGNFEPTPLKQFVDSEIFQKIPTTPDTTTKIYWTPSSPNPNWPDPTTSDLPTTHHWTPSSPNPNWPDPTTSEIPQWSTSTQKQQPYLWTTEAPKPTTIKLTPSTKPPKNWTPSPQDNTYNSWDQNTWTTKRPTTKPKVWTTAKPTIQSKVWTTFAPKIVKATELLKVWTTSTPKTTKPTVKSQYWTSFAPKKNPTKKAVLPAPSDPTQALFGNFQVTSNPWPSQFTSDLLKQVGKKVNKVPSNVYNKDVTKQTVVKNNEISQTTEKNYFSMGHAKATLKPKTGVKLPNFETESFSSFGRFESGQESIFGKFDSGRNKKSFITAEVSNRPKKEVKQNDQKTYFSIGQDAESFKTDSSPLSYAKPAITLTEPQTKDVTDVSNDFQTNSFSNTPMNDIVELYIPDPLAPGHPQGNGNHGWAPIEEWAKSQRESFYTTGNHPSWANSAINSDQIVPSSIQNWANQKQPHFEMPKLSEDWKKREIPNFEHLNAEQVHKPGKTITTIKKWTNPSPATYIQPETTERYQPKTTEAPKITSTLDQATETIVKSLLNTNSYPIPVTPRYHNPFDSFASLDINHLAGPTGPPGIAIFHTNPPIKTAQQLQLGNIHINSNSHYMKQNPFLASPITTNAPSVKRNVDQSDFWSYNPVTESSVVKAFNPYTKHQWDPAPIRKEKSINFESNFGSDFEMTSLKPTVATSSAQITGYSYNNVNFPNGVKSGYDSYHYKTAK